MACLVRILRFRKAEQKTKFTQHYYQEQVDYMRFISSVFKGNYQKNAINLFINGIKKESDTWRIRPFREIRN